MGRYPKGPKSCLSNPSCHVLVRSMSDAGPITIFVFWGLVASAIMAFQLSKYLHLKRRPVRPFSTLQTKSELTDQASFSEKLPNTCKPTIQARSEKEVNEENLISIESKKELQVTGYTWSIFGEICYLLCCLTSLQWICLFILILFDTYDKCEVGSIDNLCFFGDNVIFGTYEMNGKVFFVVWWLSAAWFTVWVLFKGQVHNWFRVPCDLSHATVAHIWSRDQEEMLSTNVYPVVIYLRRLKNFLSPPESRGHSEIIVITTTKSGQRLFWFQGQRFLVEDNALVHATWKVGDTYSEFYQEVKGLSNEEAERRLEYMGLNEIPFKPEPFFFTLYDELFSFFHVYQLVMYMLQFWNSYLFVASLSTCIVLLSASITIYTRRRSQFAIAKITEYVTETEVLRSGVWKEVDSRHLVPGDLVRIRGGWLLPCDFMIIQGSCICDESALTGEAMPVQKYNAPSGASLYEPSGNGARYTLFSGTTVLQAGNTAEADVLAIVSATGMATSKGELLASILYPQKMVFKYDEELPIIVILLIIYGLVCFGISLQFQDHSGSQSIWITKWIYCMAIINQILNPLLPVALEIGQVHAVERLKALGIFCLNPKRIAIAGKIRLFCFDKTGTLTREGLDFTGVQCLTEAPSPTFGPVLSPEKRGTIHKQVLHGLATCHAVTKFGKEYVGNQVEVKMFSSIGWELFEDTNGLVHVRNKDGIELTIIRCYEFDHARATMSVIVQDQTDRFQIYCKGSFEKIQELSSPTSLPSNYSITAQALAFDGCYVLGLGHKTLGSGLSVEDVLSLKRDDLEKELDFLALLIFRNELKEHSRGAIEALKDGQVRPVMVTGDNAQCGHYIAKQCSMVASDVQVFLGDVRQYSVGWSLMDSDGGKDTTPLSTEELLNRRTELEGGAMELAITGKAFNQLRRTELMDKLLLSTRIFARFTPEDKVKVAKMHRDHGLVVGMCGDGGNDCGALRAAHAGLALSEAEASVVSPFTSKDKSVKAVVDLVREGRGALHTSFACYKFLIMYGLMFSILKLCSYWYGIIPCQMDFISIDGIAVLILAYGMTLSYPEDRLGQSRPTSSLLGPSTLASTVGVWVINVIFLGAAVGFMVQEKGYVKWPARLSHSASWWTLGDNWESTVLFFTMYFQYITAAFIYTFGSTYRKSVFANWLLVVSYVGLLALFSALLLLPSGKFTRVWHVASEQFNRPNTDSPVWALYQEHGGEPSPEMPFSFRLRLLFLIFGSLAAVNIWQKLVVEGPIAAILAKNFPTKRLKLNL